MAIAPVPIPVPVGFGFAPSPSRGEERSGGGGDGGETWCVINLCPHTAPLNLKLHLNLKTVPSSSVSRAASAAHVAFPVFVPALRLSRLPHPRPRPRHPSSGSSRARLHLPNPNHPPKLKDAFPPTPARKVSESPPSFRAHARHSLHGTRLRKRNGRL